MRNDSGWVCALLAGCLMIIGAGCGKSDLSTPKAAAMTFAKAIKAGDAETAKKASTGADAKNVESVVNAFAAMSKLQQAAKAKYGDDAKTFHGGMSEDMDMTKAVEGSTEKINGDTATLTPQGPDKEPLKLKKVDGDWKVDVSELGNAANPGMMDQMGKVANELTDEINAGKYKTAADANQALGLKMMSAAKIGGK